MPARLFALVTAAVLSGGAAQQPAPTPSPAAPGPPSKTTPQVVSVTLTGCLNGSRFEATPGRLNDVQTAPLGVTEFTLQGPREVLQALKRDHNGHEETITGVVIIPPQPADATIDTGTARRGKAPAGGARRDPQGDAVREASGDVQVPVRIRVQSARHVADRCVVRQ